MPCENTRRRYFYSRYKPPRIKSSCTTCAQRARGRPVQHPGTPRYSRSSVHSRRTLSLPSYFVSLLRLHRIQPAMITVPFCVYLSLFYPNATALFSALSKRYSVLNRSSSCSYRLLLSSSMLDFTYISFEMQPRRFQPLLSPACYPCCLRSSPQIIRIDILALPASLRSAFSHARIK